MLLYESVLLFDPELEDEKVGELIEKQTDFISKHKGEIISVDRWGKRPLAYEINKFTKAHYVLVTFKSKPQTIKLIERQHKLSEPIIRSLTVKKIASSPNSAALEAAPQEEK